MSIRRSQADADARCGRTRCCAQWSFRSRGCGRSTNNDTFGYLEIHGTRRFEPDDTYNFAAKVGPKYGADLRLMDGPRQNRVVVTTRPTRINALDLSADLHRSRPQSRGGAG